MHTNTSGHTPSAHLLRAAAAETLDGDPGSVIALLADVDTTAGLLTSNRSLMRAGSEGAPPHYHRHAAELFFVLDGRLEVLLDDRIDVLEAGDLLVVPPGMPHAFAPTADSDADVLFVFTPGTARSDYYRLLDQAHRGEVDWSLIAESQDRFDNHYVDSAIWARRAGGATAPAPHQRPLQPAAELDVSLP
jgi:mannose-6-phosphate isomerase-like protein (cupin superfamily)